jgi:hypothetical protein
MMLGLEGLKKWLGKKERRSRILAMALSYSTTVLPNVCPLSLLAVSLL